MDFDDAALWLAAVDEYTADGGDMEPFKVATLLSSSWDTCTNPGC